MHVISLRRAAFATLASSALTAGVLAAPSAHAVDAPSVDAYGSFSASGYLSSNGNSCASTGSGSDANVTVPATGKAATITTSRRGTVTDGASVTDVAGQGSAQVSSTLTATGGRVVVSGSITSAVKPRATTGGCNVSGRGSVSVNIEAPFTTPVWVTVAASADNGLDGGVSVNTNDGGVRTGPRGKGSLRVLLKPNNFNYLSVSIDSSSFLSSAKSGSDTSTVNGRAVLDFAPAGSGTKASGKARKLVVLGSRECTTGTVAAGITKAADRKAKKVVISVNGKRVVTLKGKSLRKRVLNVPAALSAPAAVKTTVVLKSGKKLTGKRSYLACSD